MSVILDILFPILKYAVLIFTAAMALIALRQKTKDDRGKLTKAGRRYNKLIIGALIVGILNQTVDDLRQRRSTAEQLKRNTHLLEQVVRGQYPLQNIRASYQLRVPTALPGMDKYELRLTDSMPKIAQQLSSTEYRQSNDIRFALEEPRDGIMFCQKSPLMPLPADEPDAARLVGALNVRVLLYRKPIKPEQWPLFVGTGASAIQPDVEMWFSGGDRCIDYRARNRQLILRDIGATSNPDQWESSGVILSVLDLRGAQMVVDIHPRRTDQLQGQLQLYDFELYVGSLQAFWLPKDKFKLHQLPNGDVAYEFVFPETLEEILALQRRYGVKGAG